MTIAAFALIAFAVYVWVLWIRKTFHILFLLPAVFITRYALRPAIDALAYGIHTPQIGGRMFGGFIVLSMLSVILMRPRQPFILVFCGLILLGVLQGLAEKAPTLDDLVRLIVVVNLAFIVLKRRDLLAPRPKPAVRDVFE